MAYGAVIVCKLARCHAGPGCPICEDVPCDCARCREAKAAPAELPGDRGNLDERPTPEAPAPIMPPGIDYPKPPAWALKAKE